MRFFNETGHVYLWKQIADIYNFNFKNAVKIIMKGYRVQYKIFERVQRGKVKFKAVFGATKASVSLISVFYNSAYDNRHQLRLRE